MSGRTRQLWWASFAVIWALGVLWALATPLIGAPDEDAHAIKAAALADGQWRGRLVDVPQDDADGPARQDTLYRLGADWAGLHSLACFAFDDTVTPDCAHPLPAGGRVEVRTHVGSYPPLYYLAVGWPSRWLAAPDAVRAMRILTAGLCAALVASAVVASVEAGGRLAVVGPLVAMTPMALFLFGAVNPSALEVAGAIALWCSAAAVALLPAADRRAVWRMAIAVVAVAGARPGGPVIALGIVAVVALAFASRDRLSRLARRRDARLPLCFAGGVLLATAAWSALVRMPLAGDPVLGRSLAERVRTGIDLLQSQAVQLVGRLGWLDTPLPRRVAWWWWAVVVVVLAVGCWRGRWRQRLALVVVAVATPATAVVIGALQAPSVGFVWQGRYSLPLFAGVPIVASIAFGRRPVAPRASSVGAALVLLGCAASQVVAFWTAMSRNTVGLLAATAWRGVRRWEPPGGAAPLVVAFTLLALGGAAGLAWWETATARGRPPDGVAAGPP